MTRGKATGNLVAGKKVEAVITGHIGRKATGILKSQGVKIYLGAKGTLQEVIELFKQGRLEEA